VAAVAQIGQNLDLETIAEGVETAEQAELLRGYGCPYGQGFQFARPAPADDIELLLRAPDRVLSIAGNGSAGPKSNGHSHSPSATAAISAQAGH
jgi:predicted signal transduction protein with EAL and GGDEF domain